MKPLHALFAAALLSLPAFAADNTVISRRPANPYPPGPDSQPQEGVAKGERIKGVFDQSKIFPGTTRSYTVYVPTQLDKTKPAPFMVLQDGGGYRADVVFDNLIHKKEIPALLGIFVMHGRVVAHDTNAALDRFNRSYEYDGLGDNYARFLIDELFPFIEQKHGIKLSKNANEGSIGGASSGAICAWTAAWERPDRFRRVFSSIGTYVGLRGGNDYPTLIRKVEPKPIRIFLQDGENDLNIYGGDWWMANQEMERALVFAGYDVNHAWGKGVHDGNQSTQVFPDALRWLWRDYPTELRANAEKKSRQNVNQVVDTETPWELVGEGYKFTEGPAVNAKGEVFFNDVGSAKTYKVGLDGKVAEFLADSKKGDGQAFGPDGKLYANAGAVNQVLAWDESGKSTTVAEGFRGNDIVVLKNGFIYVTEPGWDGVSPSKIWLIKDGEKKVVDTGLKFSNGITASPDQTLLYVADSRSHWVYSYQIQPDGTLKHKQKYYWLHVPDTADDSGADGMRVDRAGRLYVATRMGIQFCDQPGRVNGIIPTPNGKVANIAFGGENFDTLFAMCGDKVFKRKVKVKGAHAWDTPNKPPVPGL
jgi:sugar lactone lactonase YvrE/enterochelin esterase-like enzyme